MKLIEQYRRNIVLRSHSKKSKISLFDYIVGVFNGQIDDTDNDSSSNQSNEMGHWEGEADLWAGSDEIVDDSKTPLKKNESFDYKAHTP